MSSAGQNMTSQLFALICSKDVPVSHTAGVSFGYFPLRCLWLEAICSSWAKRLICFQEKLLRLGMSSLFRDLCRSGWNLFAPLQTALHTGPSLLPWWKTLIPSHSSQGVQVLSSMASTWPLSTATSCHRGDARRSQRCPWGLEPLLITFSTQQSLWRTRQVAGCTRMEPWSCLAVFLFSLKMSSWWQMAYQIIFVHLTISACWLALAWRSPASERVSVGTLSLKKSCSEYGSWGSGLHNLLARKPFSLSCPKSPFLPSHPY